MNFLSEYRRRSNRVWWKMVRKTHLFTKSDEIRVNLGGILIGFRVKWTEKVFLDYFLCLSKSFWKENSPAIFVFAIFTGKVKYLHKYRPKFSRSRFTFEKLSEFRRCFSSGSWKVRKMKPSRLFRTCTAFLIQILVPFCTSRPEWKLTDALKQKWKRFVKGNPEKLEIDHFDSIWSGNSRARWNPFLKNIFPNLVPNQCFLVHFAWRDF